MPRRFFAISYFFLKPFRRLFGWIFFLTALTSLLESINLAAFLPLFQSFWDAGTSPPAGRLQLSLMQLSRRLPFEDPVVASAVLVLLIMLVKFVLVFLREALTARGAGQILYSLKSRMIEHYSRASYPFFLDAKEGTLVYNCVASPTRAVLLALRLPQTLAELLKIVAIMALLCLIWPSAAVGLIAVALAYNGITHGFSRRISYLTGRGRTEADAEQTSVSHEFFSGIRQILTFRTSGYWLDRFRSANQRSAALYAKDAFWVGLLQNLTELSAIVLLVGLVVLLKLGGPASFQSQLPVVGVFALALLRLLPSISHFGRQRMEMLNHFADAERLYAAMTQPVARLSQGEVSFTVLREGISFEKVSFSHKGRPALLTDLNLRIERGCISAIVGPSGAGKSTLVNLLLGLFEPQGGRILIDGRPLQDYRLESWLKAVGFVSQDTFIFHASIAENILFGRSGFSHEEIVQAARIANAESFILELPHGYETVVGERGMKLSGGQQQRIAIARAMLSRPQILVFDEATSHLDALAEGQVQEAIERVSKDHTVILIAHRLSTVRHADKIVVLDRGRILEEGRHEQLLTERGRYFQLVTTASR